MYVLNDFPVLLIFFLTKFSWTIRMWQPIFHLLFSRTIRTKRFFNFIVNFSALYVSTYFPYLILIFLDVAADFPILILFFPFCIRAHLFSKFNIYFPGLYVCDNQIYDINFNFPGPCVWIKRFSNFNINFSGLYTCPLVFHI